MVEGISKHDERLVEVVARALCLTRGYDPDRLEPGNLPYLDSDEEVVDGRCSNGDPGFFYWRAYASDARAALDAINAWVAPWEANDPIEIDLQWPPIETAPNGGQIRAFVPNYHQGKGRIIVATWLDWKESGCGWYDNHGRMVEPTHWIPPLPDE